MRLVLFSAILTLVAATGCSTSVAQVSNSEGSTTAPEAEATRIDEVPLIKGPVSPDGLQAIFGTPDLGLGKQRVGVVLISQEGLVRSPAATFTSFYFQNEGSEGELRETTIGFFRPFPLNTRGMYTTELNFDKPGRWVIEIAVLNDQAQTVRAKLYFKVKENTAAPSVGAPAIASDNKTLSDVDSIAALTTGSLQDPDLYQTTIAEAIKSGLPTVVVMASPAFCTNAVCGPQVEVLQQLKDRYKSKANFIHVDLYDNPQEIQGDLSRAVISPTVIEWNLPSSEWAFVIDKEGVVAGRFESFATFEEIEEALLEVL
jgi:hypothetical protein